MPDIQSAIFEQYADQGVAVVGLNPGGLTGNDEAYAGDYADNLGLTFPILMDVVGSYQDYKSTPSIAPFPLDVVVDSDGTILLIKRDFDVGIISATIDQALGN